jgi:hypothetical protein
MIIRRENKQKRESLVDARQCEEPKAYSSSEVIVRALQDKISSEMSAANEHSQMIEALNGAFRMASGSAY